MTADAPSSDSSHCARRMASERVADGGARPAPAARRLDRRDRALATIGERREEQRVVGPRRRPAVGERPGDLDRR